MSLLSTCDIHTLMSESCHVEVGTTIFQVLSISIPLGKQLGKSRFIVIEGHSGETPKERLLYNCFSLRVTEAPKGFRYNKRRDCYRFDHLSLRLHTGPVTTIELLERFKKGKKESVACDAGLIITRKDKLNEFKIALVCKGPIFATIDIAHTPTDIQKVTEGMTVRVRLGS